MSTEAENVQLVTQISETQVAERGAGVCVLMAFAGHRNIMATHRYIDLRPARLNAAAKLF